MSLQIQVIEAGAATKAAQVEESVFGEKFKESLVHQVVVAYQASARSGTKAQKSRSEVSGGGAKPWRQKGGGRARAGSSRSPIWRTGGVTFAASKRSYDQKVNRKMYRAAMRSIFSELLRQDRILISDDFEKLNSHKTKCLVTQLKHCADLSKERTLIVTAQVNENLALSSRNLFNVRVMTVQGINPLILVNSHKVFLTSEALKLLEEGLK